jgi:hypothetical protein
MGTSVSPWVQAAVPKTMTLQLLPASAPDVPPGGGVVTQVLNVVGWCRLTPSNPC